MTHVVSRHPEPRPADTPAPPPGVAEAEFYQAYPWCLNPYPTVRETLEYLGGELARLGRLREGWQLAEVMTNVYLLACAVANSADEYLRGKTLHLPKLAQAVPFYRTARWALERAGALRGWWRRARVRRWREDWRDRLDAFLALFVAEGPPDPAALAEAGGGLDAALRTPLPRDVLAEHIFFPSAFRKHDLTHFDVLALGRLLVARFPDRRQPVLALGLRTAGSYFAPLLRALLKAEGYAAVDSLTVRPEKGLGAAERAALTRRAREGYLAVILDDPPRVGDAFAAAADMARKAGFAADKVVALAPVHPATGDWTKHPGSLSLANTTVLTLEAGEWHKPRLLEPAAVEGRLAEYFRGRGFVAARVVAGAAAESINAWLQAPSEDARRARLKRVYEVWLQTPDGREETRFVLAKSVGWGWLGYHAFLIGHRLAGFVPSLLGQRDGILYSEWLPQTAVAEPAAGDRERWITTAAAYVAARVRCLGLGTNPLPSLGAHRHHDSFRLLDRVLSRAYGGLAAANLARPRLRRRLCRLPCPHPTLIDGKMDLAEWVAGPAGLLKTDYEHHGMGKNELNVVDPAYDLAEAIFRLELTPEEEDRLVRHYVERSGDADVGQRLFLNKVLAGTWATAAALKYLFRQPPLAGRQQEFNRQFVRAWHFLATHAARFCGTYCRPPAAPGWRSPLVVLDIDGVLDRRVFGFPCTTAAGVEALALLHAHDIAVAVDTARSVAEVKEYCRAYGLAGGVAEYGAYAWDAVAERGRALVGPEALRQLGQAREALGRLPGVFFDDRYEYSVRAHTFEDRPLTMGRSLFASPSGTVRDSPYEGKYPVPLPTLAVRQVLAELGLDRLAVHQTTIDTTIVAREVDKGTGLLALLDLAGLPDAETIAVGDSEPDLPMFGAAGRSFAPSHIGCAKPARSLGCRIARRPSQRGLLDIARAIVHPDGKRCRRCPPRGRLWPNGQDLFLDLLRAADRGRVTGLLRALLDPRAYQGFLR
jgi:hydroxymethylpyrimidine pyrophosphatase-like HAD family hydrolase